MEATPSYSYSGGIGRLIRRTRAKVSSLTDEAGDRIYTRVSSGTSVGSSTGILYVDVLSDAGDGQEDPSREFFHRYRPHSAAVRLIDHQHNIQTKPHLDNSRNVDGIPTESRGGTGSVFLNMDPEEVVAETAEMRQNVLYNTDGGKGDCSGKLCTPVIPRYIPEMSTVLTIGRASKKRKRNILHNEAQVGRRSTQLSKRDNRLYGASYDTTQDTQNDDRVLLENARRYRYYSCDSGDDTEYSSTETLLSSCRSEYSALDEYSSDFDSGSYTYSESGSSRTYSSYSDSYSEDEARNTINHGATSAVSASEHSASESLFTDALEDFSNDDSEIEYSPPNNMDTFKVNRPLNKKTLTHNGIVVPLIIPHTNAGQMYEIAPAAETEDTNHYKQERIKSSVPEHVEHYKNVDISRQLSYDKDSTRMKNIQNTPFMLENDIKRDIFRRALACPILPEIDEHMNASVVETLKETILNCAKSIWWPFTKAQPTMFKCSVDATYYDRTLKRIMNCELQRPNIVLICNISATTYRKLKGEISITQKTTSDGMKSQNLDYDFDMSPQSFSLYPVFNISRIREDELSDTVGKISNRKLKNTADWSTLWNKISSDSGKWTLQSSSAELEVVNNNTSIPSLRHICSSTLARTLPTFTSMQHDEDEITMEGEYYDSVPTYCRRTLAWSHVGYIITEAFASSSIFPYVIQFFYQLGSDELVWNMIQSWLVSSPMLTLNYEFEWVSKMSYLISKPVQLFEFMTANLTPYFLSSTVFYNHFLKDKEFYQTLAVDTIGGVNAIRGLMADMDSTMLLNAARTYSIALIDTLPDPIMAYVFGSMDKEFLMPSIDKVAQQWMRKRLGKKSTKLHKYYAELGGLPVYIHNSKDYDIIPLEKVKALLIQFRLEEVKYRNLNDLSVKSQSSMTSQDKYSYLNANSVYGSNFQGCAENIDPLRLPQSTCSLHIFAMTTFMREGLHSAWFKKGDVNDSGFRGKTGLRSDPVLYAIGKFDSLLDINAVSGLHVENCTSFETILETFHKNNLKARIYDALERDMKSSRHLKQLYRSHRMYRKDVEQTLTFGQKALTKQKRQELLRQWTSLGDLSKFLKFYDIQDYDDIAPKSHSPLWVYSDIFMYANKRENAITSHKEALPEVHIASEDVHAKSIKEQTKKKNGNTLDIWDIDNLMNDSTETEDSGNDSSNEYDDLSSLDSYDDEKRDGTYDYENGLSSSDESDWCGKNKVKSKNNKETPPGARNKPRSREKGRDIWSDESTIMGEENAEEGLDSLILRQRENFTECLYGIFKLLKDINSKVRNPKSRDDPMASGMYKTASEIHEIFFILSLSSNNMSHFVPPLMHIAILIKGIAYTIGQKWIINEMDNYKSGAIDSLISFLTQSLLTVILNEEASRKNASQKDIVITLNQLTPFAVVPSELALLNELYSCALPDFNSTPIRIWGCNESIDEKELRCRIKFLHMDGLVQILKTPINDKSKSRDDVEIKRTFLTQKKAVYKMQEQIKDMLLDELRSENDSNTMYRPKMKMNRFYLDDTTLEWKSKSEPRLMIERC